MMLFSFVIPTYNLEKYISKTLQSVISQTSNNYEIILIDDGSSDSTVLMAQSMLEKFKGTSYKIISQENRGVSSARNRGIQEATGDYIIFLDGDDLVECQLIEEINKKVKETFVDVVFWKYDIILENKKSITPSFNLDIEKNKLFTGVEILEYIFSKRVKIRIGSAAYRKDILIQHGLQFAEGCINGEDQEFIYKTIVNAEKVSFLNQMLHHYILCRNDSISNSFNLNKLDAVNAFKRLSVYVAPYLTERYKYLIDIISNHGVINEYFSNLISCIEHYECKGWYRFSTSIKMMNKINLCYPGLIPDTKKILINSIEKGNRISTYKRMYIISPYLYCYIIMLKTGFRRKFAKSEGDLYSHG